MPTDQTKFALILTLVITSHYFTFSALSRSIVSRKERPTNGDRQAALAANSKSAKPSTEVSKTDQEAGRWPVAKDLLENLVDMKPAEIVKAFGIPEGNKRATYGVIYLGKGQQLRFSSYDIVFKRTNIYTDSLSRGGMHESMRTGGDPGALYADDVYTGAPPKEAKEYWTIIKANLDKFIGMNKENVIALMGPERCASKDGLTLDYRVGDDRFRLYFEEEKVSELQLRKRVYDPPGTVYRN